MLSKCTSMLLILGFQQRSGGLMHGGMKLQKAENFQHWWNWWRLLWVFFMALEWSPLLAWWGCPSLADFSSEDRVCVQRIQTIKYALNAKSKRATTFFSREKDAVVNKNMVVNFSLASARRNRDLKEKRLKREAKLQRLEVRKRVSKAAAHRKSKEIAEQQRLIHLQQQRKRARHEALEQLAAKRKKMQ